MTDLGHAGLSQDLRGDAANARQSWSSPRLTVDCVVFALAEKQLNILLIQRAIPPFQGCWALPGGFVRKGESLESAARRELQEESGLGQIFLEQLYSFGDPGRDPRGHVVSVTYYALVNLPVKQLVATTDAQDARWFALDAMPSLAFDHQIIFRTAHDRLRAKLHYQPIGFELLPSEFTLSQLQSLYETVWDQPLDKRNFRRKILSMGILKDLNKQIRNVAHRPSRLYAFDQEAYVRAQQKGFYFEV